MGKNTWTTQNCTHHARRQNWKVFLEIWRRKMWRVHWFKHWRVSGRSQWIDKQTGQKEEDYVKQNGSEFVYSGKNYSDNPDSNIVIFAVYYAWVFCTVFCTKIKYDKIKYSGSLFFSPLISIEKLVCHLYLKILWFHESIKVMHHISDPALLVWRFFTYWSD